MGFYPVAVYYNKTQHTNNTPHSIKHSTQSYTNNKGHTTHNEDVMSNTFFWINTHTKSNKKFILIYHISNMVHKPMICRTQWNFLQKME
jgi:hypothetical protein